jgi:hypothetical protein
MLKSFSRCAVFAASGGVVVLVGAALPAQAAAVPGWRVSATFPVHDRETILTSVAAVTARDAWSAGISLTPSSSRFGTLIRHWNGTSWVTVSLPSKVSAAWNKIEPVNDVVGATSPSNVWVFGGLEEAAYLRLNGTRWSLGHLPGARLGTSKVVQVDAARVFSRSNVWVFGFTENLAAAQPAPAPYAAHFDGSRWAVTHVPGNSGIAAVSAASTASIWAVAGDSPLAGSEGLGGSGGTQSVLHWTPKGGWRQLPQPTLPAGSDLSDVLVQSGHVTVGGSEPNGVKGRTPLTISWNGKAWSQPSLGSASSAKWRVAGLAPDGRGGTWVLGIATNRTSTKLWHLARGKWTAVHPAFGRHAWIVAQLAAVPHTDSVWGAGALKEGKSAVALMALAGPTPR